MAVNGVEWYTFYTLRGRDISYLTVSDRSLYIAERLCDDLRAKQHRFVTVGCREGALILQTRNDYGFKLDRKKDRVWIGSKRLISWLRSNGVGLGKYTVKRKITDDTWELHRMI